MIKTYNLFRQGNIFVYSLLFFNFYYSVLFAQDQEVSGQITDGQVPISGATIRIKHQARGTVSNFDGYYKLYTLPTDTLEVSFIGYKAVEVAIGGLTTIDVVLKENAMALGEVTINAGYYTVKNKERTGSISRVTEETIEAQPVNTPLEALQGRVAGLDIVGTTGLAGGGYSVRIRGQNSITAGNDPLYVIDGVPYDMGTLSDGNLSGLVLPGGIINPLNTLDPNSIASIEVLKDADATAIYGSRGSNGVVLITTKKGQQGKTKISLDISTGLVSVTKMSELLNTEQYLAMREEAFTNDGVTDYPSYAYDVNGTWDRNRYTDWQKEFIGNEGYNYTIRAAISGGSEQTRFDVGGSFMKETTVFPMDFNYKKYTVYSTLSHQSHDEKLRFQFTTNYGQDSNYLPTSDLIRVAKYLPPNAPEIYDEEGNLNWENSTWNNPYGALESTYTNDFKNLLANATFNYRFMSQLDLKLNLGYSHSNIEELQLNPHTIYNPAYGLTSSSSNTQKNEAKRTSWIIEPQLDFSQEIGKSVFRVTLGGSVQEQMKEELALLGSGFINNQQMTTLSSAEHLRATNDYNTQYRYVGIFARLNFNWKHKYLVNLTGRRDGSSRFGTGNQFANFGAIGLAWVLTEENFLKNSTWINFAKLRTSYGTAGNDQIGDYQYLNTYSIEPISYGGQIGLYPTSLFNPDFGWESIKKFEVALETNLWHDRLSFEVAYYHNRSDNQLLDMPLPTTTGFSSLNSNFDATVDNYGWELGLQTINLRYYDFEWRSGLELSIPRNKLVAFKGLENSTYNNQLVIGEPLTIHKLYNLQGVNTETGLYEFVDYNQDGEITAIEDRQVIGDLSPKFYGGLSNSLRYKNWSLDFLLQFTKKDGLNEFYNTDPPGFMQNQTVSVLDHWQANGTPGHVQAYTAGNNFDAYYTHVKFTQSQAVISDASFIRLKSFSLSYKLPLKKESSTSCTLSLQGQNVLTFTNFKGGDPEQLSSFLPPLKRYSIRVFLEL